MKVLPADKIREALNILAGEAEVYAPLVRGCQRLYHGLMVPVMSWPWTS